MIGACVGSLAVPFVHARLVDRLVDRAVDRLIHRVDRLSDVERLVHRLVDGVLRGRLEEIVEDRFDPALGRQDRAQVFVETESEDVDHFQVERVVDGQADLPAVEAERQDDVLLHQLVGDEVDGVGRDGVLVEVDVLHAVLHGQGLVDHGLATHLEIGEGFADAEVFALGMLEGAGDVLGGDGLQVDENFAQLLLLSCHGADPRCCISRDPRRRECGPPTNGGGRRESVRRVLLDQTA
jgi:hypothetical protein